MNYFLKEYRDKFYPTRSIQAVRTYIIAGHIPSHHIAVKGKQWVIEVPQQSNKEIQHRIYLACDELWSIHNKTKIRYGAVPSELINMIAEKYGLNRDYLKIIIGVK